jgi:beta-galactosidase
MQKYPPVVKGFPHMLHGADYNPEQWRDTKEIWREDMRLAKFARMNSLSVGIFAWAALEPEEGKYDFAWLDEVLGMMAENGMIAVLATPSGARPPWLARKYPEVLRVDADRQKRLFGGRHNHCFTSPVYREKVRQINTRLAERYKGHPALGVWHVSNEYSGECHCELCRQAFREWLRARYGSLHALNRAWWSAFWSHTYTDWEQIDPPSPKGEYETNGLLLDWKRFVTHQTVDFLKAEMEPLRRIAPGVPCTSNMMGFFDGFDYYRMAEELDVISWDNYPVWRGDEGDAAVAVRASLAHDIFRGLKDGRPFMMMESTPSVVNWQAVNKLRRPGAAALQGLQAVAHGSDTVQYFQFRKSRGSFEKFHGAVVDHEGSENTRVFKEVAATGEILSRLDAVVGTVRKAAVALIYDVENGWALREAKGYRQENNGYVETLLCAPLEGRRHGGRCGFHEGSFEVQARCCPYALHAAARHGGEAQSLRADGRHARVHLHDGHRRRA